MGHHKVMREGTKLKKIVFFGTLVCTVPIFIHDEKLENSPKINSSISFS